MLAVHSLSKRSNLAGARAGFYAGDPELVHYLSEVRKHAGFMVPGPVQAAAVAAFADDAHVDAQRERYRHRLALLAGVLALDVDCPQPAGAFYLWAPAPGGDAWGWPTGWRPRRAWWRRRASSTAGAGSGHVRLAVVQPDDRLELVAERLGVAAGMSPMRHGRPADHTGTMSAGGYGRWRHLRRAPTGCGPSGWWFVVAGPSPRAASWRGCG